MADSQNSYVTSDCTPDATTASGGKSPYAKDTAVTPDVVNRPTLAGAIGNYADAKLREGHRATARRARFASRSVARFAGDNCPQIPTRQWLDSYCNWLSATGASPNTIAAYLRVIRAVERSAGRTTEIFSTLPTSDSRRRHYTPKVPSTGHDTKNAVTDNETLRWYCLRARRGTSNTDLACNLGTDAETYCPDTSRMTSDRDGTLKKRSDSIVSTLLFVRTTAADILEIATSAHKVATPVVYSGSDTPAAIPDSQLRLFRLMIDNGATLSTDAEAPQPGTAVRIIAGIFSGLTGTVTDIRRPSRVKVSIEGLCAMLTPELHPDLLQPLIDPAIKS